MEVVMQLQELIKAKGRDSFKMIFTESGELGFIGDKEIKKSFGEMIEELHDLLELENKLIVDIDSQGYSELEFSEVTKSYLLSNLDCKLEVINNKIIIKEGVC